MNKNKLKENNGITLIALIITIIVMLILVAVTITVAVNGGLFEYAGRAGRETQNAIEKLYLFSNTNKPSSFPPPKRLCKGFCSLTEKRSRQICCLLHIMINDRKLAYRVIY